MRALIGWILAVAVSVGLGLALYTTSLAGSTTDFQEAAFTPRPTSTVVKTETKIVRKPAKTRVVYVPQAPAPAPVTTQRVYVGSDSGDKSQDSSDDKSHDDSDDDD